MNRLYIVENKKSFIPNVKNKYFKRAVKIHVTCTEHDLDSSWLIKIYNPKHLNC